VFKPNLAIIGPNKSINHAVGELLSQELQLHFLEFDLLIEWEENLPIFDIVQDYGSEHFYKLEKKHIRKLDTFDGTLITTSATTIMDEQNALKLSEFCTLILLSSDSSTVLKRMREDQTQHLKSNILARSREFFANINTNIKPLADIFVDTTARSPGIIKDIVIEKMLGEVN